MRSLQKSEPVVTMGLTSQPSEQVLISLLRTNQDITLQENAITFLEASKGAHLRDIVKKQGRKITVALLVSLMARLQKLINSTRQLNNDQITIIAMDLIEVYPYESLEDFTLMFKMARQNRFTTSYGTLDSVTIHKWMGEYLDRKAEDRENRAKQAAIEDIKQDRSPSPILEKILQETKQKEVQIYSKDITFEKHIEYLKSIIPEFHPVHDEVTLSELKNNLLKNNSISVPGIYDDIIEMVNKKLGFQDNNHNPIIIKKAKGTNQTDRMTFEKHLSHLKTEIPKLDSIDDNDLLMDLNGSLKEKNKESGFNIYDEVIKMVDNKLK